MGGGGWLSNSRGDGSGGVEFLNLAFILSINLSYNKGDLTSGAI